MSILSYIKSAIFFTLISFMAIPKTLATEYIAGEDIQELRKNEQIIFNCPKNASAIELCNQENNVRAIACNLKGPIENFMVTTDHDKGTVIGGKKEYYKSYLLLSAHSDNTLNCSGYFGHPNKIYVQGIDLLFNECFFAQGTEVFLQPSSKEKKLTKYIQLLPINKSLPIYIHGQIHLENFQFAPCEKTYHRFIVANANIVISLNE